MLDEEPSDQSAGPGPFNPGYPSGMQSQSMQPPMPPAQNPPFTAPAALAPADSNGVNAVFNNGINHLFDPYDPMLDADPFGLSASMHFPTSYSYEAR